MNDYSQNIEYERDLVPAGTYEAVISNAEIKVSKTSGNPYISLTYMIRDDVEQEAKGRLIYDNVFKVSVYTRDGKRITKSKFDQLSEAEQSRVVTTKEYQDSKIRPLLYAQDAEEDKRQLKFDSIEELVMFLNGMNLNIKVGTAGPDNFHDTEVNVIDYRGLTRTNNAPKKLGVSEPVTEEISDDDLPF